MALITFSGLDGAGKSTLIAWLRGALEERRHRVAVLHLEHDVGVYAALRRVRGWLLRIARGAPRPALEASSATPSVLRRVRDALVWSRIVRGCIYPLDVVVFLCYRAYIEGLQGRVLIMDRYFYDTLADLSAGRGSAWIRWLARITPTPTVPFLVETGPEEAYARKREYSVAYLRERWAGYRRVFPRVRGGVGLRNDDLGMVRGALRQVVLGRLGEV